MKTFSPRSEKIVCATGLLWRSAFAGGGINRSPMTDESEMNWETIVHLFFRISRLIILLQDLAG